MLAALLEAAAVADSQVERTPETVQKAGSLLKRLVAGLLVMVEARARAKAQMGAEMTGLQLDGNNPIKFARSPEQALAQLLNPPAAAASWTPTRRSRTPISTCSRTRWRRLAAIPGALRATLDRFSPGSIRRRAETHGLLARILPGARDAALWRNYEREFVAVKKESDEAFMEVFSKEFRKAYERQLRDGCSQERPAQSGCWSTVSNQTMSARQLPLLAGGEELLLPVGAARADRRRDQAASNGPVPVSSSTPDQPLWVTSILIR